jgi:hypothetical protein
MVDRSKFIKFTDEQIISAHRRFQNAKAVSKELGVGHTTVLRILAKHGIRSNGLAKYREDATLFKGDIADEIVRKYQAGTWVADLVKEYGGSYYSIKKAILRAGVELREDPAPRVRGGEAEEILELYKSGKSQLQISLQIGRSQPFISRTIRKAGMEIRNRPSGSNHPHWKGGRVRAGDYWRVRVENDDPMASMRLQDGYVAEHRLVMARSLGRPLRRTETVHHINGDSGDNRIENLQLRQGKHGKHAAMICLDCGSHNVGPTPLK